MHTWQSAEDWSASDAQRAALVASLANLLMWGLGRPGDADDAVRRAARRMEDPAARHELDSVRILMRAISADTTGERIEHATAVLGDPGLSKRLRANATLAAITALSDAGHFNLAIEIGRDAIATADGQLGGAPATRLKPRPLRATRALSNTLITGAVFGADSWARSRYYEEMPKRPSCGSRKGS